MGTMLWVESGFAAYMNCGVHIIEDGRRDAPGKYEVLKKCGEPTFRSGNTWVYEAKGRTLHFDDSGRLTAIRTGGR